MNSVERVKLLCKERKIPIYRLEKDLGYANGYINQLRKGTFPADRLSEIAKYLSVSSEFLLTGEDAKKTPTPKDEREFDDFTYAMQSEAEHLTDMDKQLLISMARQLAGKAKNGET